MRELDTFFRLTEHTASMLREVEASYRTMQEALRAAVAFQHDIDAIVERSARMHADIERAAAVFRLPSIRWP
jgi:hypothetical protein